MNMSVRSNGHFNNFQQWVYDPLASVQATIEELAMKLGGFTLILGLLLFANFFMMLLIQKPKKQPTQIPFNINEK